MSEINYPDEKLDEVERRIACACAELWRESRDKSNAGLKHYLSVALHGGTEETKEQKRQQVPDRLSRTGGTGYGKSSNKV